MCRGSIGRWVVVCLQFVCGLTLMNFGMSFAGVGGSVVPTVSHNGEEVQVGESYDWSFTITNTSTSPNDTHRVKVLANDGGIFFTTACGVPDPSGKCPDDQRESPDTITINSLSATGHTGTACEGINFTVSPTGIPNEYRFEPTSDIFLDPSSVGGLKARCQVDFTVTINANPVHDSSPRPGLQTSQLARVDVLMDEETNEKGSAAGTSTVQVLLRPTITTVPDPTEGKVGDTLKDRATLSEGWEPTGTITFKLFDVTDPTCSGNPIFIDDEVSVNGNGTYETSSGFSAPGPGTYHWTAEYSGDSNNLPASSRCSDEPVAIKCPTKIVTEPNPSDGKVGELLKDKATLSEGCSPTGTITFKLFNVTDPSCSRTPIFTNIVSVNGNGIYETSSGFPAPGPGTYHWTAEYSGDPNNLPATSRCSDEPVVIKCEPRIVTEPKPSEGKCGEKYKDKAILSEGCNPTGTITFKLFQEKGSECAGIEMFTEWVSVDRGNNTYESPSRRINAPGIYHWVAEYSGDSNNLPAMSVCEEETVVVTTPCVPDDRCNPVTCLGECPYVGIVGNDIDSNPFYFGCAYEQFLRDQTDFSVPVCWESFPPLTAQTRVGGAGCEQFRSNKPTDQPEVCDVTGTVHKPGEYTYRGEPNAVIRKQNSGYFEWFVRLPVKPGGEINLVFQCGVLKPNAFAFEGFDSVLVCAAETGERIGKGFCTHDQVPPNVNPIINSALPRITAIAYPGPYSPGFKPFHLTAYKNPGAYDLTQATGSTIMSNSASLYVLDGSTNARILLKSCMDKTIVAKIPVTGQRNAVGEFEHDLEAGDLIYVRMYIPSSNTVDIYCNSQSLRVSGIGEGSF